MMKHFLVFFTLSLFFCLNLHARKPQCNIEEEKKILKEVYLLSDTAKWKGINWASEKPIIQWEGIELTRKGCVRSLTVPDSTLNKEGLVNLQGLRKLRNIYIKGNPNNTKRTYVLLNDFRAYPFMNRYSVYYNNFLFFRYGGLTYDPWLFDPFWYGGFYAPRTYFYSTRRIIYRPTRVSRPAPIRKTAPNLKGFR